MRKIKLLSPSELEAQAMKNINNYEGDEEIGLEDGIADFGGIDPNPKPFSGLKYHLTITNTGANATDKTIALLAAYFGDKAQVKDSKGDAVDGILCEGNVVATVDEEVVAVGKPKSIDQFLKFISLNPCRITGMRIKTDDTDQFDEDLLFRNETPFRDLGFKTETPNTYLSEHQQNEKIVSIPLDTQFDNQTTLITTIQANRTVTYTFFIGAISNEAADLDRASRLASRGYHREV
jgi:hypothetical protein